MNPQFDVIWTTAPHYFPVLTVEALQKNIFLALLVLWFYFFLLYFVCSIYIHVLVDHLGKNLSFGNLNDEFMYSAPFRMCSNIYVKKFEKMKLSQSFNALVNVYKSQALSALTKNTSKVEIPEQFNPRVCRSQSSWHNVKRSVLLKGTAVTEQNRDLTVLLLVIRATYQMTRIWTFLRRHQPCLMNHAWAC